jgi:hypothetical protein
MDTIQAKFREIREDPMNMRPDPITVPATLADVSYIRHPKAKFDADYVEPIKKEIDLDFELGLKGQYELDQNKMLRKDIDELTKSNDYWEVSKGILRKLFKIPQLEMMCVWPNLKEAVVQTLKGGRVPLVLFALTILLTIMSVHLGFKSNRISGMHSFFLVLECIAAACGAIVAVCMGISSFFSGGFKHNGVEFNYCFLGIKLEMEPVSKTTVKIPYPVKLKMKEAKDSGLFEGFSITYPQFYTDNKHYKPNFELPQFPDPIVLGIAKDNRMFMVAWWDIKHDIDRVKTNIKKFKKFKIV